MQVRLGGSDPDATYRTLDGGEVPHPSAQRPPRRRRRGPTAAPDELVKLSGRALVNRCVRLRPDTTPLRELIAEPERLLVAGAKTALRDLADRCKTLDTEIKALSKQITALVTATAPALVELMGVGAEIAGQLLMTAGDNPERLRSERAFAKLCGVPRNRPAAAKPAADIGSAAAATELSTAPST